MPFYSGIIILIMFSLVLDNPLHAGESKLTLSKEFYLFAINGKAHPATQRQPNIVSLKQGFNKIALQYRTIWNERSRNAIAAVNSKIFIVSFYLAKKDNFRLSFLKPATYLSSLQFSKSPKIKFINETRQGKKRQRLTLNISTPLNQSIENVVRITKKNQGLKRSQSPIMITGKKQEPTKPKLFREN